MKVFIGADHRGFDRKEFLKAKLSGLGVDVVDCGAAAKVEGDDYPDFAASVAKSVLGEAHSLGILACGSGAGVDIAANKFKGIRSVLGITPEQVSAARSDDDANILSLASDYVSDDESLRMVLNFLNTGFDSKDERYVRRLEKITQIENA